MSSISRKVSASNLNTLTKADFECQLVSNLSVSSSNAKLLSEAIVAVFKEGIEAKKSILMARVGTLDVVHKSARPGRNPKTLEDHNISARYSVTLRKCSSNPERLKKPDLFALVKDKAPHVSEVVVRDVVNEFMDFVRTVSTGKNRVEIRGLGVFYPSILPERKARNPKTGEEVIAKESVAVRFKCSKIILGNLN